MKSLITTISVLISVITFGQIQHHVNKSTGTASNLITEIDSIRFNANQTEMEIIFNDGNMENHSIADITNVTFSGEPAGQVTSINCASASINGVLIEDVIASGVSAEIEYVGGNGGSHEGQTVSSTGVTGLTATLDAGNFANGAGTLIYDISGTPSANGTANFAIVIGGETCDLVINVLDFLSGQYAIGSVFCASGPTEIVEVVTATGRTWMDRNLGASQAATSSTDQAAHGGLFQWGRAADGHQCRTSPISTDLSSADQPAHGDFILAPSFPWDWRSPQNDSLWQGVNGVNNPCPLGFRLPTAMEWNNEVSTWSFNNAAGAFNSPLKISLAGARTHESGDIVLENSEGLYWTSSMVSGSENSQLFHVVTNNVSSTAFRRARGYSVRCIKD